MKNPKQCDKSMSFTECELAVLRSAVDLAQEKIGKRVVNTPEIQEMITIVENFIRRKNLVCYGGTAINNILPKEDQFYDRDVEIPDYDFFSPNSLDDAKELANIFYDRGYAEVEAKSGQHAGTFKVFVNFIAIADITYLPPELFDSIQANSIRVAGILYTPPNYLRMSMFLELSRPAGDTDRWEKIFKRLTLLNKHYPLVGKQCATMDFQRKLEGHLAGDEIYDVVKDTFINQGVVFFGGYAISIYSKYMPKNLQKKFEKIPDFDVLSNDPKTTAEIVKERLKDIDITNVKIVKHDEIGDVIPEHYEIIVEKDTIAFIYKPVGCHSYNNIHVDGKVVKIATIDTMLSFYLAFLYTNRGYFDPDRILCMSQFLFDVEQKNRLEQKGVLRRFSITCYGHQNSIEEIKAEKAIKYKELKDKRGTKEYEEYFLSYKPSDLQKLNDRARDRDQGDQIKKREKKKAKGRKTRRTKKEPLFDPYNSKKSKTKTYKKK
jgi:hypothetical protein